MPYGSADSEQSMQSEIDSLKKENAALKLKVEKLTASNKPSAKLLYLVEQCKAAILNRDIEQAIHFINQAYSNIAR